VAAAVAKLVGRTPEGVTLAGTEQVMGRVRSAGILARIAIVKLSPVIVLLPEKSLSGEVGNRIHCPLSDHSK
jgi:hypothetical protein